mmetsp:Transcript_16644/g.19972  ORF Transcript_16644/g.19972 Transcript_16644/m.19972 type:complete len:558 (-) Transcript_16644:1521-3194(-)
MKATEEYTSALGQNKNKNQIPTSTSASESENSKMRTSTPCIVEVNVGGELFTTSAETCLKECDWLLACVIRGEKTLPKDGVGRHFIDRDGNIFKKLLNYIRTDMVNVPEYGGDEWNSFLCEVEYYNIKSLIDKMDIIEQEVFANASLEDIKVIEEKQKRIYKTLHSKEMLRQQGREIEKLKVEMQKLQYEKNKTELMSKHRRSVKKNTRKEYAFNLIIAGVTGTGKSSSLNTILDTDICKVGGAQAQGTRGTILCDGTISEQEVVSFIDTQGLGADTSITDQMLLEQIMLATESILKLEVINNVLISFDLNLRATPATMANQLTLIALFNELRPSCFLCFTKWNTNSVMHEWNTPLRLWVKKYRRAATVEEITEDPPSYEIMYQKYCTYIVSSLANEEDGGAFSKMGSYLAFFEARVLWMYNLDAIQQEDKCNGDLEPYCIRLYEFYRDKALQTLRDGSTVIHTKDLVFLKSDKDTMQAVSHKLISSRDKRLRELELMGRDGQKRERMKNYFNAFVTRQKKKIAESNFAVDEERYVESVAQIAGTVKSATSVGCSIQ